MLDAGNLQEMQKRRKMCRATSRNAAEFLIVTTSNLYGFLKKEGHKGLEPLPAVWKTAVLAVEHQWPF